VAIFGIAVAAVVYLNMRPRDVAPAPSFERLDPEAVLETSTGLFQQVRGEQRDLEIAAARTLMYRDGSTKQFDVRIGVHGRTGRDFAITAREAHSARTHRDLQLIGDVTLVASDGFELATARGSFNQDDGIVRAPESVVFGKGRMNGSGAGMIYDERQDLLRFASGATVRTTHEDGRPQMQFTAATATLDRARDLLTLEGQVEVTRDGQRFHADQVIARLSEDESLVTFVELRGGARVSGGDGSLDSMVAERIDLDYGATGERLERVALQGSAGIVLVGEQRAAGQRLFAQSLVLELAQDGTLSSAVGRHDVRFELPTTTDTSQRIIVAGTLDATGRTGIGLTDARFGNGVEYRESAPTGVSSRIVRSQALHAALTDQEMSLATFIGHVTFQADPTTGYAGEAQYEPDGAVLRLKGSERDSARVRDDLVTIHARTIDLVLETRRVTARGDVRTTLETASGDGRGTASDPPAQLPGLLEQDEPAHVTASTLEYDGERGNAVYSGGATLWQKETAIRADVIEIDQRAGDLVATGSARSTIAFEGGASDGRAHEIAYHEAGRRITYAAAPAPAGGNEDGASDDAHVSGPQGDLKAARIELVMASDATRADRIEAYTRVRVRVDSRTATGDRLTYHADDDRYELVGAPTAPVRLVESCREAVGRTLIFFTSTDRMIVDGDEQSRTQTRSGGPCPTPLFD
jgi:lipopolysaccharide export system protein LptA